MANTDFKGGIWQREINTADFIQKNYTPYTGSSDFLASAAKRTLEVMKIVNDLLVKEHQNGGVLDIDTKTPSSIISHEPGYISKDLDRVVGLQTNAPLKRAIKPRGGVRLVKRACEAYGYTLDPQVEEIFSKYAKTHNDSVFDIYTNWADFYAADGTMLRKKGIITGLPDNYGRGRIIGDYRRVALYGTQRLIEDKKNDQFKFLNSVDADTLELKEKVAEQIKALKAMTTMAASYGYDISQPATSFFEAVQWTYFAFLAAIKEQDGAAMSLGRVDAFLDIYAQRELEADSITEEQIQEIIDDFVIKLRLVRHLRVPEYNELFAGDPTWVTALIGGTSSDGRTLVTKTTFRLLQTLKNLGPAPEPNITIAWNQDLPTEFKKFASEIAITTCAIQFENDQIMKPFFGDDYGIACCVSAMRTGKEMQFFGARCNLAKLLLLCLNEGKSEIDNSQVKNGIGRLKNQEVLDYEEIKSLFFQEMQWLAERYVETMNVIHYMHDKYNYEAAQMALHDTFVSRMMAFGVAGFSVAIDSLSAIKHAQVRPIRNQEGVAIDFEITGDFPKYGNDDDRVDAIAVEVIKEFYEALKANKTYKNAKHTLSILTITANVVYGAHTGATPDGRKAKEPFAPGANPMHNRDEQGAISSLNSVAKIPYEYCLDGISDTFSITPGSLGKGADQRINNLKGLLDGYFHKGGFHLNINVLDQETLIEAMNQPEKYPQLTIRVSGYAVRFINLNRQQQKEVIERTFHSTL
jgi:formate C-acetyltransferase